MMRPMDHDRHLRHAERLALRGHGGAEPNPMVGCVIVSDADQVVGWGYHRKVGQAHAEVNALQQAGAKAAGATAYVTLEPCNHIGRTGPCTEALIQAGIRRVVIAQLDPNPAAAGGVARLRNAGVEVVVKEPASQTALVSSADPFLHRVHTGLPWVIAKWAQTLDGKIATRTGQSHWISGEQSRRMVHRERGRVCAIMTGIGTVLADDPMLTARNVRLRRTARRVVVDPNLEIPPDCRIVTTAKSTPTTIACCEEFKSERRVKLGLLQDAGVEVLMIPTENDDLSLRVLLQQLVATHQIANVLVEAGPGLMGRLFRQNLVNEAWVFIASLMLGDHAAPAAVNSWNSNHLTDGHTLTLLEQRTRGVDVMLRYRCHVVP